MSKTLQGHCTITN